jgi:ABC-type transport system involved in multi-copper enzyme maturation permease subunit
MRTLIWKEWRQVRALFFMAIAILVGTALLPFTVLADPGFSILLRRDFVCAGAALASVLTCLGLGVIGYGLEFSDRTAAYLATRPVTHNQIFLIKVGMGLLACLVVAFFAWVLVAITASTPIAHRPESELREWFARWWLVAPTVFFAVQTTVLLIRPMVPALIVASTVGILALYASLAASWWILIPLWAVLVAVSRSLASARLHAA